MRRTLLSFAIVSLAALAGPRADAQAPGRADVGDSAVASGEAVPSCPGDCDGGRTVTIGELVRAVNVALEKVPVVACEAADIDGDGSVTVSELIKAVQAALHGCATAEVSPTPTSTSLATVGTATATPPVATRTATPTRSATRTATTAGTRPTATETPTRPTATATPTGCPENMPLSADVAYQCSINSVGDSDVFRIVLTERTRVLIQATEIPPSGIGGWDPCLALLPDLLGGAPIASQCDSYHPRLDLVLEAGTYFAMVSDQNDNQTGDYEILYEPLRPVDAVTVPVDEPLPGAVAQRGEYDLYTFTLTERTRVLLQATETPPNGGDGWNPCLTLLPDLLDGAPIVSVCDTFHPRIDQVLEPGTYYVLVNEQFNYILGDYEILYQPLRPADAVSVEADEPFAADIGARGDYDLYTFTLAERTRVILQGTEIPPDGQGGWNPCLTLLPDLLDGAPIASTCDPYHPHIDQVLDPGTYYVLINEQFNYILGEYELLYQPLRPADATVLSPDEPTPGTIDVRGDYNLYTFTLSQPTRVILQANEIPPNPSGGWNPCLILLPGLPDGAAIASLCDAYHPRVDQVFDPGTYYVLIYEQYGYILGDYEILYQPLSG